MFSADVPASVAAPRTLNNRAAIYFDYNTPVITNTATTLLVISLATNNPVEADLQVQVAPNPTEATATLRYNLPSSSAVYGVITDITGKTISTFVNATQAEGAHEAVIDATQLSAGVYFLTLKTQFGTVSKRLVKIEK